MWEIIYQLAPYAPLMIFVAAVSDIFFITGLFLYGAAMMSSIAMMYSMGMISLEALLLASYSGTLVGNTLNYWSGRIFDKAPVVEQKLQHPKIQKGREFLRTKGLFFYILICRFFMFTRPLYALVLGSLRINYRRFIFYESIVALAWVALWTAVLVKGEAVVREFVI